MMAFSYAVIRKIGKEWHVSVNNYADTDEAICKSLDEVLVTTKRMIDKVSTQQAKETT